ncbi:hypothetical protein BHE74_00010884 [Ensete ventricosum]|nr:hypothetical protein GW17_00059674 [Ensete ventricosum]RWW80757.1 hypothetical protein BHE74_00010884 [Ensete ventricosum]RZS01573.1 hypothetical protein BHM03_00031454 [Ensete ventricosum]
MDSLITSPLICRTYSSITTMMEMLISSLVTLNKSLLFILVLQQLHMYFSRSYI